MLCRGVAAPVCLRGVSRGYHGAVGYRRVVGGIMAHFFRVVLCVLGFWAFGAEAETMPATGTPGQLYHACGTNARQWNFGGNGNQLCQGWYPGGFGFSGSCYDNTGNRRCDVSTGFDTLYTCPVGGNWTLSGSSCTRPDCVGAEVRNAAGVCETPNPCPAGQATTGSRYIGRFNAGNGTAVGVHTPTPSTLCDGQCTFTPATATNCSSGPAVGSPIQCDYSGTKTGAPCSGGNGAAPTYDPCILQGGVAGTLNGQPVCMNDGTGSNTVPGTTTASKTTTTPTSTTTTTTTTTCTGDGACSTTTTNQYTSGGSGPNGTGPGSTTVPGTGPGTPGAGVGESTEADSPGAFCKENPDSPLCVKGAWSGACGAQPACTGDAVQCAQAAEVFRVRCGLETEPTDAAYLLGKSIAGGGSDTVVSPMDPSQHVSVNVAERLAQAVNRPAAFSRTCFTAPSFTVMGQTYTVPVAQFCEFLAACGYMLVAASGVVGLRIVLS